MSGYVMYCNDCVSYVRMCCDMKSVAVICVMCVVLWVADEDVSFYEMRVGNRGGMRCVRDMCRRVKVRQGWVII